MPASFPGAVKTWTDKTDNVDSVMAAHMNEAYAEIIALENNVPIAENFEAEQVTINGGEIATVIQTELDRIDGDVDTLQGNMATAQSNITTLQSDKQATITKGTGTITTTGWLANTGDYAYYLDVTISGVTATDVVNVVIDKDSHDTAGDAELCGTNESYTDKVRFFCKTVPASSIPFSYTVVK